MLFLGARLQNGNAHNFHLQPTLGWYFLPCEKNVIFAIVHKISFVSSSMPASEKLAQTPNHFFE